MDAQDQDLSDLAPQSSEESQLFAAQLAALNDHLENYFRKSLEARTHIKASLDAMSEKVREIKMNLEDLVSDMEESDLEIEQEIRPPPTVNPETDYMEATFDRDRMEQGSDRINSILGRMNSKLDWAAWILENSRKSAMIRTPTPE